MPSTYRTPDVYVEEISTFPPSVAEVETAIPAFIGYTETASFRNEDLTLQPTRVRSLLEYEERFRGGPLLRTSSVSLDTDNQVVSVAFESNYVLYDSLKLFFANGGGKCYIISVGAYADPAAVSQADFEAGINALRLMDEPTMILFPDAVLLGDPASLGTLQGLALAQCGKLGDRFGVFDLTEDLTQDDAANFEAAVAEFRTRVGTRNLKYGAAYAPYIYSNLSKSITHASLDSATMDTLEAVAAADTSLSTIATVLTNIRANWTQADEDTLREEFTTYENIRSRLASAPRKLPPSGAIAGIYASVDNDRGVWKAPANVSLTGVTKLSVPIDNAIQDGLNVDATTGKSVNALRAFTGRGLLVWGSRTLDGNSNEWRYVPVRRFFNMVEESVKKSTYWAVFEPNDANLWVKVKAMIENYLIQKWRDGALAGAKPEHAFFVKIGLGETMTAQDILEGRLIVEIGMAVVRPAEFIILRFSHKMQES